MGQGEGNSNGSFQEESKPWRRLDTEIPKKESKGRKGRKPQL